MNYTLSITLQGCKIDWKKGKNVTVKLVKKKQKHKNRSSVTRTVVKQVQNESFFNFFNPPEGTNDFLLCTRIMTRFELP